MINEPRTADASTADSDEGKQTIYRTSAYYAPASPMGLLPACWKVMHHCTTLSRSGRPRSTHRARPPAREGGGRHRLTYTHNKLAASLNHWGISVIESGE